MKKLLILFLLAASVSRAHDHIEVGEDPLDPNRLGLDGPDYQLAVYVPPGEPFSGYMPDFPGGWHASELTFSAEVNVLEPAVGANPRIEIISVNGPNGGSVAFFEAGGLSPAWIKPMGWTNTPGDLASLFVMLGGDPHIHGRAFTMDVPGEYTVVFRATDTEGIYSPSLNKTITFVAQLPPPLSMRITNDNITVSFTSRLNLDYDLQSCTNLSGGVWVNQTTIFGDGSNKHYTTPVSGSPHAYYRLVEY